MKYVSEQRYICEVLAVYVGVDDVSVILGVWFLMFDTTLWSHLQRIC